MVVKQKAFAIIRFQINNDRTMENNWFQNPWATNQWMPGGAEFEKWAAPISNLDTGNNDNDDNNDNEVDEVQTTPNTGGSPINFKYGQFIFEQKPDLKNYTVDSDIIPYLGCKFNLKFKPNKLVDATQIAFIQIIQWLEAKGGIPNHIQAIAPYMERMTTDSFYIDRTYDSSSLYKYAWYGHDNNDKIDPSMRNGNTHRIFNKSAKMVDLPGGVYLFDTKVRFEVYAIAKQSNTQQNMVYGGVSWGFSTNKTNVSFSIVQFIEKPSERFKQCVQKWDDQALKGVNKNNPNQVPLSIIF
jgi:hypothetical protein